MPAVVAPDEAFMAGWSASAHGRSVTTCHYKDSLLFYIWERGWKTHRELTLKSRTELTKEKESHEKDHR
jgi:ribosome modulation factor